MFRTEFRRAPYRVKIRFGTLPGQTVHDINIDVVETCLPCKLKCTEKICGGVNASDCLKNGVIGTLKSERNTVDSAGTILNEFFE